MFSVKATGTGSRSRRVYVSCGDGSVDVWQEDGPTYRHLHSLKTASGARTSLFVPDLDRLFVAARAGFFGLGSVAFNRLPQGRRACRCRT